MRPSIPHFQDTGASMSLLQLMLILPVLTIRHRIRQPVAGKSFQLVAVQTDKHLVVGVVGNRPILR